MKKQKTKFAFLNNKYTVALIVLLLLSILTGGVLIARNNMINQPVFKVGETEILEKDYTFYYTMSVNNFTALYSQYLSSIGLDISQDLSLQECSLLEDGGTWEDFFMQATQSMIQEKTAFYNEAMKNNFSTDITEQCEEFEESIKLAAEKEGVSVSSMYKKAYGEYATRDSIMKLFKEYAIASEYANHIYNEYTPTEEEIESYYIENPKNYDLISYMDFIISAEDNSEEAISEAKEKANDFFINVYDENTYLEQCKKYSEEDSYNESAFIHLDEYSDVPDSAISEWLFGDVSKNDVSIIQDETDIHITYFLERKRNESNTVDFRHVLITPTTSSTSYLPTESDLEECKKKAESILSEWENGEKTEESFSAFAEEYSSDNGSNKNGGIYRSVQKGELRGSYGELDSWLFSESRETGDVEIIKSDYGYHIVYFCEKGEPSWKESITAVLKNNYLEHEREHILENYPLSNI